MIHVDPVHEECIRSVSSAFTRFTTINPTLRFWRTLLFRSLDPLMKNHPLKATHEPTFCSSWTILGIPLFISFLSILLYSHDLPRTCDVTTNVRKINFIILHIVSVHRLRLFLSLHCRWAPPHGTDGALRPGVLRPRRGSRAIPKTPSKSRKAHGGHGTRGPWLSHWLNEQKRRPSRVAWSTSRF